MSTIDGPLALGSGDSAARPAGVFARPTEGVGWRAWVTTVDHKKIGIMYGAAALFFFLIGGVEALLIRLQLAAPNGKVLSADLYNQVFTMHGTTMIFLVVMPIGAALATDTSSEVQLVVPLVTETIVNDAPVTAKPTAPAGISTAVRWALSWPPTPTNRLAPLIVKASTLAPSIVPGVPAGSISTLPLTTSIVTRSSVRLPITATTLPPMLSEALPVTRPKGGSAR